MSIKRPSLSAPLVLARGRCLQARHLEAYRAYLISRGHATGYMRQCEAAVMYFASWLKQQGTRLSGIDECLVAEFIERHVKRCGSATTTRSPTTARAALGHLVILLRKTGAIPPKPQDTSPVAEELRRYDEYMSQVRGLTSNTRKNALRLVGALLRKHFGTGVINFERITAERVRRFFAQQAANYKSPSGLGVVVSALRGYFRWRTTLGDRTHALAGAISYPANWQQASLPKSLHPEEVERLIDSLGKSGPSMRRADAIVRCALDLGLRSGEIARLSQNDIDWETGTITLRLTKGRREDVMPLPMATGKAIAAYLLEERPKTQHKMVFARNFTPREQPIGPDLVRKTIRQAFARAGLPHTRSHLLRHTMASRLLAGGSSLKEVADVLRHRSLNTTLIYAKLDEHTLGSVALPWPGASSNGAIGRQS